MQSESIHYEKSVTTGLSYFTLRLESSENIRIILTLFDFWEIQTLWDKTLVAWQRLHPFELNGSILQNLYVALICRILKSFDIHCFHQEMRVFRCSKGERKDKFVIANHGLFIGIKSISIYFSIPATNLLYDSSRSNPIIVYTRQTKMETNQNA